METLAWLLDFVPSGVLGLCVCTYIISVWSVQVVWTVKCDVWVCNHSSIMETVGAGGVWSQTVQNDNIALFGYYGFELLAVLDMCTVDCVDGRVKAFWVIVEEFDDT